MATVDKNFKVKHGLVVEGTTATVNGDNIITQNASQVLTNKEFNGATEFHAGNGAGTFTVDLDGTTGETTLTGNNADLNIVANGGDLVLNADGSTYLGTNTVAGNEVATKSYVDGQVPDNTDGLTEGTTNKYYHTAQAKTDAAALLTGATKTNITITGDGDGLTITAENGVADSTTSDLAEGTNLYFTDERAQDAIGNNVGTGLSYNDGTGAISVDTSTIATKTYVDGLASNYDAAGAASAAETSAKSYTDNLIGDPTVNGTSGNTVKDRIDTAVANLVDGAPALLNTLNELAAAINDDEGFSSTIATQIGGKQDALTAGDGISLGTGSTVSTKVDNLGVGINVNGELSVRAGSGISVTTTGVNVDTDTIASVDYVDTNFVNVADLPGQLGDYVPLTQKAAADGVATLDGTGNVPLDQLGNVPAAYITSVGTNLDVTDGELTVDVIGAIADQSIHPATLFINDGGYMAMNDWTGSVIAQKKWNYGTLEANTALGDTFPLYGVSNKLVISAVDSAGDVHTEEVLVVADASGNVNITEYAIVTTNASLFDLHVQSVSNPWSNANKIVSIQLSRPNGATSGNKIRFAASVENLWNSSL